MTLNDPIDKVIAALGRSSAESSDFDLNPDIVLPANRVLRSAAVLVPLIQTTSGTQVILTKRSSALKHHPGQVAFPGGKVDQTDASIEDAALREAEEEIGLPRQNVEVIGQLAGHETVTSFTVTPILGRVRVDFEITPEPAEVAEVFTVPFSFVTNLENYAVQYRHWRGRRRHYYAVPYGPYYIWGATAAILRGLAKRMDE